MDWELLVSETINKAVEEKGKPVPGAVFKKLLVDNSNEQFPEVKFSEFLNDFNHIITIIPRQGQDILIIPKGRIDLLGEGSTPVKVRQDFYKVLSTINTTQRFWYNKEQDIIQSFEKDFSPGDPNVPFPECTEETEIELRRQFALTLSPAIRDRLLLSLNKDVPHPLSAFGNLVRCMGIIDNWYKFRIEKTIETMRQWSASNNISWRESWISDYDKSQVLINADSASYHIERAIRSLSDSDLARITVPLDIVIKLLKSR